MIGLGVDRAYGNYAVFEIQIRNFQCEQFVPAQTRVRGYDQNRSQVFTPQSSFSDAKAQQKHLFAESREALSLVFGGAVNQLFTLAGGERIAGEHVVDDGVIQYRS